MGMNNKDKNTKAGIICNVGTMYSLFLYLLFCKESDISRTFFVFSPAGIPKTVRCHFNNSYTMPDYNKFNIVHKKLISLFGFIYFRLLKWWYIPKYDENTLVFGNDFARYDPIIIGNNQYTLIEDAPNGFIQSYFNFFKKFDDKEQKRGMFYRFMKFLYGETYYRRFGNNNLCTDVILTSSENLDYLIGKNKHIINLEEEWMNCQSSKRNLILKTFSLSNEDIMMLKSKRIVLFTQPLYPTFISLEEHEEIYKKIISRYPIDDLVIKPHPRDNYCYNNLFQDICVLRSPIPSQLLDLLGIRFEKAVTLFSSAVNTLTYDIAIDWYGFADNKTLESLIDHVYIPHNANKIYIE